MIASTQPSRNQNSKKTWDPTHPHTLTVFHRKCFSFLLCARTTDGKIEAGTRSDNSRTRWRTGFKSVGDSFSKLELKQQL